MDISVFTEKETIPTIAELQSAIGETYQIWNELRDYVFLKHPKATEEWNFPGKNYGWSFRIKDKKRTLIYLLPRKGYFKVALIFGEKATKKVLQSNVSEKIKTELESARPYVEGRGIRIDINDSSKIPDIKKLIDIKMEI